MKFRTTEREIRANFDKECIVRIGYCGIQEMTTYIDPVAYTCGVYGWNSNIYIVDGIAIVTGHRPFGKSANNNLVREYEKRAIAIKQEKRIKHYETKKRKLEKLFHEFAYEAIE